MPSSKPILEINPDHPIVQRLKQESAGSVFADWSRILFDQALLAEGGELEDPASFVKKTQRADARARWRERAADLDAVGNSLVVILLFVVFLQGVSSRLSFVVTQRGHWRSDSEKSLGLEVGPERRRNRGGKQACIGLHLLGTVGAWDDGLDCRMAKDELECGLGESHAVCAADLVDAFHALDDGCGARVRSCSALLARPRWRGCRN